MQEDLTSAERLKRSAMSERDELAEETQTLNREKNSAQEEKRRLETRLGDLEEEKVNKKIFEKKFSKTFIDFLGHLFTKKFRKKQRWLLKKVKNETEN